MRTLLLTVAATAVLSALGCGSGLSGDSSCADYMKASVTDQQDVMQKLNSERRGDDKFDLAVVGSYQATADNVCPRNPDEKLDEVVGSSG